MKPLMVIVGLLALLSLACQPTTPLPPTGPTTTTTTTVPANGDATKALQDTLDRDRQLYVNTSYTVNGTITPPAGSTITFGPQGRFVRQRSDLPRSTAVIQLIHGNVTLNSPRIVGPNPCYWIFVDQLGRGEFPYSQYDATKEGHHGITIEGGSNYTIQSPDIEAVWGDAINIDRQPSNIVINNLNVRCVGRSVISNTGSTNVQVNGGSSYGAFWWTFNIEPYNTRFVKNYHVRDFRVGWSRYHYIFAGGPYFSCLVEDVSFNNITFTSYWQGVSIRECVRDQIRY